MSLPQTMQGAMLLGPEHIEVRDVDVPKPGRGEILLKVEAATTCGTDVKVFKRGGHPRMLKVPTLFGHEMAGTVAAAGAGVWLALLGSRGASSTSQAPSQASPRIQSRGIFRFGYTNAPSGARAAAPAL